MNVFVTGVAGFIGYHLARRLLSEGKAVVGLDSLNDYYAVSLKHSRLKELSVYPAFSFIHGDLSDANAVNALFDEYHPDIVVNLAAQAGVRYSITNPRDYIDSNITGFFNILEACRRAENPVKHLLYASSSSVYGSLEKVPFSVSDHTDRPISLYAATKKSNELMAYCYSQLYGIPSTGLRFFTVYGPYGRPDMAYYSFAEKMMQGERIQVFNNGDMYRDFTYVEDAVTCVVNILSKPPRGQGQALVYNIGSGKPVQLTRFIRVLEKALSNACGREIKAGIEYLPMQPGDVYRTYADVNNLKRDFGYVPQTNIEDGLYSFANWYCDYHKCCGQALQAEE